MAEIPVERNEKGGLPWWLFPLLALLVLIPLLWFASRGCAVAPVVNTNNNGNNNASRAVGATNANAGGTITNSNSTATTTAAGNTNGSTISVDNKGTATGARVTDINIFGSTADKLSLAGRGVELTKVKVNRVLSDRVFTVTSGQGEMFALLDDKLNEGKKEQQIKMQAGQIVNLGGEFRRVPDAETKEEKNNRDLNAKEYAQMKGQQVYLHVQNVADAK